MVFFSFLMPVAHALGLGLSDLELELAAPAGSALSRTLVVSNTNDVAIEVNASMSDWWFQEGNHLFLPANSHERSMSAWLSLEPKVLLLAPGESAQVELTARVPSGTAPGSYFSMARFNTRDADGIQIGMSMGTVMSLVVGNPEPPKIETGAVTWREGDRDALVLPVTNVDPDTMDRIEVKALFRDLDGVVRARVSSSVVRLFPTQTKQVELQVSLDPGIYSIEGIIETAAGRLPIQSKVQVRERRDVPPR